MQATRARARFGRILATVAGGAVVLSGAEVQAQTQGAEATELEEVVVTGLKQSLTTAVANKRESKQIVDSIVAADIGKLPDTNVAEALQRVTGIQITRENGEGTGVTIRGMSQVVAQLDGRPIFSAGVSNNGTPSRVLNFNDLPSELIARADVFKSPIADQIEGGIGGVINFVTRRPLDFTEMTFGLSAKGTYSGLADDTQPTYSGFFADKWDSPLGEMGAWISYTHQDVTYRNDGASGVSPVFRVNATDMDGNGYFPNPVGYTWGNWAFTSYGPSKRDNLKVNYQWRPTENWDLFVDYMDNKKENHDNVEHSWSNFGVGWHPTEPYDAQFLEEPELATAADGTSYVVAGRIQTSKQFGGFTAYKDGHTRQGTFGATWNAGPWTVYGEAYKVDGDFDVSFNQIDATVNLETVFDFRTQPGTLIHPGTDLLDLSNYTITKLNFAHQEARGSDTAEKFDITRELEWGPLTKIKGGIRYSERNASYRGGNPVFGVNFAAEDYADLFTATTQSNFLNDAGGNFFTQWMVPKMSALQDGQTLYSHFGFGNLEYVDPLQSFEIEEKSTAGYLLGEYEFHLFGIPADGNIGIRVVDTRLTGTSVTRDAIGDLQPQVDTSEDRQVLPSANLRLTLTPSLLARFAISKTASRPEFNALNPALFLQYNFLTGSAGNPNLPALTAKQADASLEYYFSESGYVSAAIFYKEVQGFLQNLAQPEVIDGQTFMITRPYAADDGVIKGFEVGYQQFFESLPAPFDGFGIGANYTYIESEAPNGGGGTGLLPGLSPRSYNGILMYEKSGLSARLAYNYRSASNSSWGVTSFGTFSNVSEEYGQWDAGFSYEFSKNLMVTLDVLNLGQEESFSSFDGVYSGITDTDRRITLGVRFKN